MTNLYHIIDKVPPYEPEEMLVEYEDLAQKLVASGKVRIDTDDKCNFARYVDPNSNVSVMLSADELTDRNLLERTKKNLSKLYFKHTNGQIDTIIKNLLSQIKKLQPVSRELQLKLVRILVQAAHPIVIRWLILEQVEIFISYSHNIGDMMDIATWKKAGANSGMQSTDGLRAAIFVSTGGDPFGKTSENHPTYGDGWPAIARMQAIAGQEIGHYSDIMRDSYGRQIGRHSADFACTKATPHVLDGRRRDLNNCTIIFNKLSNYGMTKLIEHEETIRFYNKNKVKSLKLLANIFLAFMYKHKLLIAAHKHGLHFVKRFAKEQYMGIMLKAMIADMNFNLAPVADVYKRDNKEAEEAIACVEALARVPQQVMKWGYLTTKAMMHELYHIYYGEVIPSLIKCYNSVTGEVYKRSYTKMPQPLIYRLKKFFTKKPSMPSRIID